MNINLGSAAVGSLGTLGLVVLVLGVIFNNPDKFDIWLSKFQFLLAYIWKGYKYNAQAKEIEGNINQYATSLSDGTEAEFSRARVKWVGKEQNQEIAWGDGEVILVLRDRGARNRNFAHAAYLFTSNVWLRKLKRHLSESQRSALDVYTTSKLLESQNKSSAIYFNEDYFNPLVERKKLRDVVKNLEVIDTSGFYFSILLQELAYLGGTVVLDRADNKVIEEVNGLVQFLVSFSQREEGDETLPSDYVGKYTKCGIKIVARASTRERGNIEGPASKVLRALQSGIEDLYVIGPHDEGKDFIRSVCSRVCSQDTGVAEVRSSKISSRIKKRGISKVAPAYLVHLKKIDLGTNLLRERDIEEIPDDLLSESSDS